MYERKYQVLIGDEVVARDMDLKTATILVRALLEEYYADYTLTVSVKEMEPAVVCANADI